MIVLIPARGGSKGLPDKNIKDLNGKPLIDYTIQAALKSNYVSEVFVSTDSERIAEVARTSGANVPFLRPPELATDSAKAIDVYLHFIDYVLKVRNTKVDELIILLPTCPLRSSLDIDNAIELYREREASSVISFTFEEHPVQWHAWYSDDLKINFLFDHRNVNRQELKKSIYPNGAIYIIRTDLLKKGTYYGDKTYAYLMPRERSIDIDSLFDFRFAEFMLKQEQGI